MLAGICELTRETGDIAALERFYTEALGLGVLTREDDPVWLAVGLAARPGLRTPGPKEFNDRGGRQLHFALSAECDSFDRLRERLIGTGLRQAGPARHGGGDRSLYAADPEGNVVEIWDFFVEGRESRCGVVAPADETGGHADDVAPHVAARAA